MDDDAEMMAKIMSDDAAPVDGPARYRRHAVRCLKMAEDIETARKLLSRSIAVDPEKETTTRPAKVRHTICGLYADARTRGEACALSGRTVKTAKILSTLFDLFDHVEMTDEDE